MAEPSFTCPNCGAKFNPFAGNEPLSKTGELTCPECHFEIPVQQDSNAITGPVSRPPQTKIKQDRLSDTEVGFTLPPGGMAAGCILFPLFATGVLVGIGVAVGGWFLPSGLAGNKASLALVGIVWLVLALLCLGSFYIALDMAFGRVMLCLGPERVRVHREIFGRSKRNKDLLTTRIRNVSLAEEYYRSSHGRIAPGEVSSVVIDSSDGQIILGESLTQDERRWICYEVREYVKRHGGMVSS